MNTDSASGSPTLGMLVEMLVERVFLVSGVVNTVFCRFKNKIREFFCFSPRTKGSKAGLRGNFQIVSFPYGNAENMFCNFVVYFFFRKKTTGENSMRVHRTCSVFFSFRKKRREKILSVSIEQVLYFFIGGRKFYA